MSLPGEKRRFRVLVYANGWGSDGLEPAQSSVPESFSVYFMTHFVEVYEPDTE